MSVLSFPRLYFQGHMQWDPCTANNNDYVPAYATAEAGLDWDYLETQGVTPENFRATYRPWAMNAHADRCPPATPAPATVDVCSGCGNAKTACHMGSRWDYYGSGGIAFLDFEKYRTLTVGGDLAHGHAASGSDPLLGQPMAITGNTFGGRGSQARLVDVNPGSPWSSQIYFAGIQAGAGDTFIGGAPTQRMFSRSFMVPRNISGDLIIAGAIGVIFQATIATDAIDSKNDGQSPLLDCLLRAAGATGAQGLMMRMSAYNTLYYQNGVFNDLPVAANCDQLRTLYLEGKVFANPAYSRVVGALGVWKEGELSTAPQGRVLVPSATLTPVEPRAADASVRDFTATRLAGQAGPVPLDDGPERTAKLRAAAESSGGLPPLAFGNAWVEVDGAAKVASIDLSNAIPELTVDGRKLDYGDLSLGVENTGGFQPIGIFGFEDYDKAAYEAKAGIVDVPFGQGLDPTRQAQVTPANVTAWLAEGRVALQSMSTGTTALLERSLVAETDQRGVYVDQCRTQTITIAVRDKGGAPPPGTKVRLAEYYPWPLKVSSGQWQLAGTTPSGLDPDNVCDDVPAGPYLRLLDGDTVDVVGDTATVRVTSQAAGLPVLAFFPYGPDDPPPTPPDQVTFGFATGQPTSIDNAFYAAVRCLPFDNALVADFVDRWNGTGVYAGQPKYDRTLAWQFVYGKILYVYDMLYPVMDQFMPLGNLTRVEGAIDQLVTMVSESFEAASTLYMPVTRELSAGKRTILETWGNLVIRKYPQEAIPVPDVPCDL